MKRKHTVIPIVAAIINCSFAMAVPSRVKALPAGVKIPTIDGKALKVSLLADSHETKLIHVQPLDGEFVSGELIKSPIADCEAVNKEREIADVNREARLSTMQFLNEARIAHQKSQVELREARLALGPLSKLEAPLSEQVQALEGEKNQAETTVTTLKAEIKEVKEEIEDADDDSKGAIEERLASLNNELTQAKRELSDKKKAVRKAKVPLDKLKVQIALLSGRVELLDKTFLTQLDEIDRLKKMFDRYQEESDKWIMRYSTELGAYATFVYEFAPAGFIQALQKANPRYQFQYVPSLTANLETTIPEEIRPDSSLRAERGSWILGAKWSGSSRKGEEQEFVASLVEPGIEDPVHHMQKAMAERQSSLAGTKFISLKLSTIGYCALREPESLEGEYTSKGPKAFRLSLHYTFPVNYALKVTGRYNSEMMLHQVAKNSSKSKWFGLSSKSKVLQLADISSGEYMEVNVVPIGIQMDDNEVERIREKVKEQLLFGALEPFLQKGGNVAPLEAPPLPKQGASVVGAALQQHSNPYAFWSGVFLDSLGSMFGSRTAEQIKDMQQKSWKEVSYLDGISLFETGELTIGDLKKLKLSEKELE